MRRYSNIAGQKYWHVPRQYGNTLGRIVTDFPSAKRHGAVALTYSAKDAAPIVVAKGYGVAAESIVQRARENGLYVHPSPDLVNLLMKVDLDEQIPPQLYVAVAELLAWLYRLEASAAESAQDAAT